VRRVPVLILAAGAALVLAACGGGGSSKAASGATTTTTTAGGRGFQSAAFTTCLKGYGITLPAGGFGGFGGRRGGASGASGASGATGASGASGSGRFGGGFGGGPPISIPGVSAQKVQTAFSACRSKLPNGGRFGGGGFGGGANSEAFQAYLSCLGDHGVVVPKPTTTTSGPAGATGTRPRGGFGSQLRGLRSQPKYAAASKTCAPLLPTFGGGSTTTTAPG
jgi:hypothetical protein